MGVRELIFQKKQKINLRKSKAQKLTTSKAFRSQAGRPHLADCCLLLFRCFMFFG
jgi:hypothetical protein